MNTINDKIEQNKQQLLKEQNREIRTALLLKRIDLLKIKEKQKELKGIEKWLKKIL